MLEIGRIDWRKRKKYVIIYKGRSVYTSNNIDDCEKELVKYIEHRETLGVGKYKFSEIEFWKMGKPYIGENCISSIGIF